MRVVNIERVPGPRRAYDLEVEGTHAYFVGAGVLAHNCSLFYKDGQLTQALTRGDGTMGEDITRNVRLMQGAVKQLPPGRVPQIVYVRGEIICRKSDFAAHFQGDSNPRNTAAGTAKRQSDAAKCKHLTVVAYQYLPNGLPVDTKRQEMQALEQLGFIVPAHYLASTPAEVLAVYNEYVASKRAALDYDIDGLVIDVNDSRDREALGETNQRPKGSVAFKFGHETRITTLRAIEWQVGKSGRVTPVAIFDEVDFNGTQVKRASLAGTRQVVHLKLSPGCEVLVSRRNDVIPRLEENVTLGIQNDC